MNSKTTFIVAVFLSVMLIATACSPAVVETQPPTAVVEPTVEVTEPPTDVPPTAVQDTEVPATEAPTVEAPAPNDEGKDLMESACTKCHSDDRIKSAHKDAAGWVATVNRMVGKGADLTPDQAAAVAAYLALTYP